MNFVESKKRIAKKILPHILKNREPEQYYIEPFCGGCNVIDHVEGNRIASDNNPYLIAMWRALQYGWIPQDHYPNETYNSIKSYKDFLKHITGYVGYNCSLNSVWFGEYSDILQKEAKFDILTQIANLMNVQFSHCDYRHLYLPKNSIIYCDPPTNTRQEKHNLFNYVEFWQWCVNMKKNGYYIFISCENAPPEFYCIWSDQDHYTGEISKLFTIK